MSMPIYEVDEHELMKEECVLREGEAEIQDGTLYLTDKRIIYEIKGKRGLIRAAPPKIYMDVRLFELKNVSSAVPKLKLFTKKFLTVEFEKDGQDKRYEFALKDPSKWDDEIKRWISDARKHQEEAEKRKSEEEYRKQVEMANARSTKQNIGMAYFGSTPTKDQKQSPTHIENETGNEEVIQEAPALDTMKSLELKCEYCGHELSPDDKYCPNCGKKVNSKKK
jgi:hypothetical protein